VFVFERFSEAARRALFFARVEASEHGSAGSAVFPSSR
jgi:hypothetical protein